MFFPKRKARISPKFSSYWQGPFEIIEKCSNVTYKVNCGARGTHQVIHTDHIRPVVEQVLRDEQIETAATVETETTDLQYDEGHYNDTTSNNRKTKRPAYLDDYVSF